MSRSRQAVEPDLALRLAPPQGMDVVPSYDAGWAVASDGSRVPYLAYAGGTDANWSEELERLHSESSRTHFLDVWTRTAILEQTRGLHARATIVDLGCSTGHLLQDLRFVH